MNNNKITLGVIIGNRDFFPDALITEGRKELLAVLDELGIGYVLLDENDTPLGAVETWEHAKKCAALFRQHAEKIDGILISLPNFGDEKGIAETIKLSGLNVPILVQAFPDDLDKFHLERRRDAFCGKISVCNNLYQYDYPFSVTTLHTVSPNTDSFKADLRQFAAVCRVVKGIKSARLGAVGANSGEIWTLFLAPLVELPIPLLPIHILWINLVTDGLPALALAAEPAEGDVMSRPPRHPKESIFSHGLGAHAIWVGFLMGGIVLFVQSWSIRTGHAHWQTMVFTVLCLTQLGHVLAIRSEKESLFKIGLFSNKYLLGAVVLTFALQMATIYVPVLNPDIQDRAAVRE